MVGGEGAAGVGSALAGQLAVLVDERVFRALTVAGGAVGVVDWVDRGPRLFCFFVNVGDW